MTHFFFHMAYFCRAWVDSRDFTRDMLKCNTTYYHRVESFALVVFAVGHLLQLALVIIVQQPEGVTLQKYPQTRLLLILAEEVV